MPASFPVVLGTYGSVLSQLHIYLVLILLQFSKANFFLGSYIYCQKFFCFTDTALVLLILSVVSLEYVSLICDINYSTSFALFWLELDIWLGTAVISQCKYIRLNFSMNISFAAIRRVYTWYSQLIRMLEETGVKAVLIPK
jgi:hypothetical protein